MNVSLANGDNFSTAPPGSSFMTGGTGNDTFYMDDREPTSPVFSTIVNFHSGDDATIWGVNPTDFKMFAMDNQGAAGFTGLDLSSLRQVISPPASCWRDTPVRT